MEFGALILATVIAGILVFLFNLQPLKLIKNFFKGHSLDQSYLKGLNFLLNEQPDKAVDIFIELFEVNSNTVETHLAMGNLFRKRGEVDKAIRIHQNLVTQTSLPKKVRIDALSALGEDYLKAGVLDRAERIFQEVVVLEPESSMAFKYLLEIYQKEKSWHEAIVIAEKLSQLNLQNKEYEKIIAQYNCEVADDYLTINDFENTTLFLERAQKSDAQCLRACLILVKVHLLRLNCVAALESFSEITATQPSFLFYCVHELLTMSHNIEIKISLHRCLAYCIDHMPSDTLLLLLNIYPDLDLTQKALTRLQQYIYQTPALLSLTVFFRLKNQARLTVEDEQYIRQALLNFGQNSSSYRCEHCGFSSKKFHWLCPGCKKWEEMCPRFSNFS